MYIRLVTCNNIVIADSEKLMSRKNKITDFVMKKIKLAVAAIVMASALSSCTTILPVSATSNPLGTKRGTASALSIFGFFIAPDASIKTATENGGIKRISTVDHKITIIGPVMIRETIVTGE